MVIATQSIAGDKAKLGLTQYILGGCGLRRQVIHARGNYANRSRDELAWAGTTHSVPRHVVHFAVTLELEPALQETFVVREFYRRNAYLLKAELIAPLPDLFR